MSSISRCFSSSSILRRCSSGMMSSHSLTGFSSRSGVGSSMLEKLATCRSTLRDEWGQLEGKKTRLKSGYFKIHSYKRNYLGYLKLRQKFICCTGALVALSCFSQPEDLINIHLLRKHRHPALAFHGMHRIQFHKLVHSKWHLWFRFLSLCLFKKFLCTKLEDGSQFLFIKWVWTRKKKYKYDSMFQHI